MPARAAARGQSGYDNAGETHGRVVETEDEPFDEAAKRYVASLEAVLVT